MTESIPTNAEIAARLCALEDEQQIATLIASYAHHADAADVESWVALFIPDGRIELATSKESVVFSGHDGLRDMLGSGMARALVGNGAHFMALNSRVTVDGDDASASTYSIVFVRGEEGFAAKSIAFNQWIFARTADGWRIRTNARRLL